MSLTHQNNFVNMLNVFYTLYAMSDASHTCKYGEILRRHTTLCCKEHAMGFGVWTLDEVAAKLKTTTQVIQGHIDAGRLRGVNVAIQGRDLRFHDDDLRDFLQALRTRDIAPVQVQRDDPVVPLPGVYRINTKPSASPGYDPFAYCMKEGIAGMGWAVDIPAGKDLSWEEYRQLATQMYTGVSMVTLLHDLPIGAVIWTRTGNLSKTRFVAGLVQGPWEYRNTPEARDSDIVNIRPVVWYEVGGYDAVPQAIVNAFTASTLAPIKKPEGIRFTQALAARLIAAHTWPALSALPR
jgi:hypothetical protein